jgi:hypothetical protein
MIYHVLPGDAQVAEFNKTNLEGKLIVCREALIDGPIDADSLDEFWQQRALYISGVHGDDEIEYHEKVADPLSKLTELNGEDEVNLWFEYELFCSVNLWFCLSLVEGTGAAVYRVEPIGLEEENRWDGFGNFKDEEMLAALELRSKLSDEDIKLGADLWRAYSKGDLATLAALGKSVSDAFPHLGEVTAAAAEQDILPLETVREITAGGEKDFGKIFVEFKKRAGVYGYGDTQVQKLLDQLS